MVTVTFEELQQNFEKYVKESIKGNEIIIMKDNKKIGKFEPSMYVIRDCLDKLIENGEYNNNIKKESNEKIVKGQLQLSENFDEVFDALDEQILQNVGEYVK